MENSRRCDIFDVDIPRASFAKQSRRKKRLEKIKHEEKIIPEWLIQEPILKKPKK